MTYLQLACLHLATVVPAFVLGSYLMLNRKGTSFHKSLDKLYLLQMLTTTIVSLFMSAEIGPSRHQCRK